jgi:hypothetical protein
MALTRIVTTALILGIVLVVSRGCSVVELKAAGLGGEEGQLLGALPRKTRAVTVLFGGKAAPCGTELQQAATQAQPEIFVEGGTEGRTDLLVMVDPDAPGPDHPAPGQWLHWMHPEATVHGDIVPYQGPSPPEGTHRYVVVLLTLREQKGEPIADYLRVNPPPTRFGFELHRFIRDRRGSPWEMRIEGAAYFRVQSSRDASGE